MPRPTILFTFLTLSLASILIAPLAAQDTHAIATRPVLEPFFPPSCGTVDAQLQSTDGTLSPAYEQHLDTDRIQKAIDRCGKGRALTLRVDEQRNAFLTGPLTLRPDVALILGRGVTLFASSDPRQFDLSPGSCTVVNGLPSGCKPLISVSHATGDGIMGDGVIDGRGRVARLISVDNSDNFTLYRITLHNLTGLNLTFDHGKGLTVWGVHVNAPDGATGKTGGIAIGSAARNVGIASSYIDSASGQTEIELSGVQQSAP